jgi:hypothetical protein
VIVASILTIAALMAVPQTAPDTTPKSVLIGVDANPPANLGFDSQTQTKLFQMTVDAGVTHLYVHPIWNAVETQQNSYDFSDIDFQAQLADQANLPISLDVRVIDTSIRAVPGAYSTLAWDDPLMAQALINLLTNMAPHLRGRVRWLALGNEVDNYLAANPAEIGPYATLIINVMPTVRSLFPGAQVSVNFTNNAAAFMNSLFSPITTLCDFFSYTYYPLNPDFTLRDPSVAQQEIGQLVAAAGDKPVLLQEVGYASSTVLNSSPAMQAAFLQNVFNTLRFYAGRIVAANFVWLSDLPASEVDQLTAYYGQSNPNFREFLSTLGYLDTTGQAKPAWLVFKQNAPSVYVILDSPDVSLLSTGASTQPVQVGFAQLFSGSGSTPLAGLAVLSLREGGVTVSEASVPATSPDFGGRMYAEVSGAIKTGLAMANPGTTDAVVNFYFTDQNGINQANGTFTIAALHQMAVFLDESPFNLGPNIKGTLTFSSSVPIASLALRGRTNERSEFIFSTVQASDFSVKAGTQTIPHFADSGGWTTQVILVNPTNGALDGTLRFLNPGSTGQSGQPLSVATTQGAGSDFRYHIPPNSFWSLATLNAGSAAVTGSIRILPDAGDSAPSGHAVLSYRPGGVTISEASVFAIRPGSAFRLFVESSAQQSVQTGIAVANGSSAPIQAQLDLLNLDGSETGRSAVLTIPANGHVSAFLAEIPGLAPPAPFQAVLRVSAISSQMTVVGIRGRYNERSEFLMSTVFPTDESAAPAPVPVFPHVVDGGGFTTELVLYNPTTAAKSFSGSLQFYSQSGATLYVGVTPGMPTQ